MPVRVPRTVAQRRILTLREGLRHWPIASLAWLLALSPVAAFAQRSSEESSARESRETDVQIGLEHLEVGDYEDAIESFEKAVEAGQDVVRALRGWADALVATGKYEEAVALLEKREDFDRSGPLVARAGRIALRVGDLDRARELLSRAAERMPRSAEALYHLGETHRRAGRLEEATKVFDRAIDAYRFLDPDDAEKLAPEDFVYWGLTLVRLNRYRDADDIMFSQAEELDKDNPTLLLERGRIFHDKFNYPDSRKFYREALDLNRDFADANAELAANYLSDFLVGTKRYDQAEKYLERALRTNPRHAKAHEVRGKLWLSDGRLSRALEDLEEAVRLDRASMSARGLVAAAHYLMGNRPAFEKAQAEALAINPKGAEFFHAIAGAIEQKFRYPDTVRMCDRALELDEQFWPAYVTLGINCLRTGDRERGRAFIDKSWEHDRFNPFVFNTRVLLRHMDREFVSFENERFKYFLPRADAPFMRPYLEPLLDEAHRRLSERYKLEIDGPIEIEAFSQHKWFSARTVGLEGFAASGACFGKLVTLTTPKALPQNWGAVAWHEFAHVVTIQLTDFRVPRWLTEGISVYEEGHDRPHWTRNFQRDIADAWGSGRLLPIGELDFGFTKPRFPNQILLSYYQGCLIVEYITSKWGFGAVLEILDGYKKYQSTEKIFRDVLGQELEEFDRGFGEHIAAWVKKNGYAPVIAEDAIVPLELRKEKDPENVAVLNDLAWAYMWSGNDLDASLTISKALELDPDSGDANAIRGMLLHGENKLAPALERLERAVELGTRFGYRAHALMGEILARQREYPKAIERWEEAKRISPVGGSASRAPDVPVHLRQRGRMNVYYNLAKYYEEIGEPEKAILQMEELARHAVEDMECRYRLVKYALERNELERAAKYLDELFFINPFESTFHKHRARIAEELGDHRTVIREIGVLLLDPATDTLTAHLSLARAHLGLDDRAEAAREARIVLDIDPENADAREILEKAVR